MQSAVAAAHRRTEMTKTSIAAINRAAAEAHAEVVSITDDLVIVRVPSVDELVDIHRSATGWLAAHYVDRDSQWRSSHWSHRHQDARPTGFCYAVAGTIDKLATTYCKPDRSAADAIRTVMVPFAAFA